MKAIVFSVVGVLIAGAIGLSTYWWFTKKTTVVQVSDAAPTTPNSGPAVPDPKIPAGKLALATLAPSGKAPTPAGVAKALEPVLKNPNLAAYSGEVLDAATGAVLWKKDAASAQIPASAAKLLTGAALLTSVKDPNARLVTTVVQGDQAGDIVVVGGGDVTLSARQVGTDTVYPGAPTVADLAEQVKKSGVEVKRIVVDTSYWTGPELATGWKTEDIRGSANVRQGYITKMQALMVDGDRENPALENSIRTGTPALTAGAAMARALGNANIPVIEGTAPPGGKQIAEVRSQPLSILLSQALANSDNVLAEALAREVARAKGAPPSFEGAAAATLLSLQDMKIDTINVELYDGSGISENDRVTPDVLAQVVAKAVAGKNTALRYMLTGLPVAGVSGTLTKDNGRFITPASQAGVGWIRAKTGSLNSTYVFAGYTPDLDGRLLVFSLVSNASIPAAPGKPGTRSVQDEFATVLRQCGCTG